MNWSMKSDENKFSPKSWFTSRFFHLISRSETISLSHDREDLLHVQHIICWNMENVWPILVISFGSCVCWVFPDLLERQVSLYLSNLQVSSGVPGLLVSTGFSVLTSKSASIFHPWKLGASSWLRSLASSFPILDQSVRQGGLSTSGLFDAIGLCTVAELVETRETKFIIGSDFTTILSSFCSCILFAIVLVQLVKLNFWAQQRKLQWLMFNRWRRLLHSSRVKFPCVNMSASWCLVSTNLMWILWSRLILSNNRSRATLWVLDTCLRVRLRPLMINLITASSSSKMYSIAPNRENLAFDGTHSTLFRSKLWCWVGVLVSC